MTTVDDRPYALDLLSPIRHVATALDRTPEGVLSLADLAAGYRHPNPSDITRIKQYEDQAGDLEAGAWLIEKAIAEWTPKDQIELTDRGYYLKRKFGDLRYGRALLARVHDPHVSLRDAFNPQSGRFSDNVRRNTGKDGMEELRESMRSFGWIPELPAIKDERGVVLVGHRRLAIAAELGITPVIHPIKIGDGDEADAKRFALAIASNLGGKPFTPEERKDIAEYLYGEREWTMQRIADALNVTKMTISRDLGGLSHDVTTSRPKGGRPKGSGKQPTRQIPPEQEPRVDELVAEGANRKRIAEELGIGQHAAQLARERSKARIGERAQPRTCICPNCGHEYELIS